MTALALEIGTTTTAAATVREDGNLGEVRRVPLPAHGTWDACGRLLLDVAAGETVTGIGIGSVGPIDMSAGIAAPTGIPEWQMGFDINAAVHELFPDCVVGFAFAGVCLTLAEHRFGKAQESLDALAISVGTHLTGGVLVGGFTAVGHTGNSGNIGHIVVPGFIDPCTCGGRGCAEAIASEPAVLRWAHEQGWNGHAVEELLSSARAGDPIATTALQRAGTALGQAISSAAALLDVELVVLGGPLTQQGSALWRAVGEAVATHARVSYLSGLRVVASDLGESATLMGAGLLALMSAAAATAAAP